MLTDMMKDELVKGLLNLFHENLSMIILYGSVARNEATSESDIDIAIKVKEKLDYIEILSEYKGSKNKVKILRNVRNCLIRSDKNYYFKDIFLLSI